MFDLEFLLISSKSLEQKQVCEKKNDFKFGKNW